MNENESQTPDLRGSADAAGSPVKARPRFLRATEAMMNALDAADGMSPHELRCFLHNTQQFVAHMIERAEADETSRKYPMTRYNWGKHERPPNETNAATAGDGTKTNG